MRAAYAERVPNPLAPRYWGGHLLAVVLVGAAAGLGVWQYDAWQAHRTAEVEAWLQPPEGTGQVDDDPSDDVLPQLRIADLVQHVDQDLYGAYGVAEDTEPGLEQASVEQLPDAGTFTGIRNLLYAVEWWFFGLFAAFIWWRWVTETAAGEEPTGDGAEAPATDP